MGDTGDTVGTMVIIAIVLFLLFFLLRTPSNGAPGGGNPPPTGGYWTLNLSANVNSSVTSLTVGAHYFQLNETATVVTAKDIPNQSLPGEAWFKFSRWRLNGSYLPQDGNTTITVGPAANSSTLTLDSLYYRVQAVFFPNATFARGQTYTVSLKFVNQYEGMHNAQIELSTDPYGRATFSAAAIGTDYALGAATGFENCWNVYTPLGLKHINGVGSSDDYPYESVSEWQVKVTVSATATVGLNRVMVATWGTGDDTNAFCGFNNYRWYINVT